MAADAASGFRCIHCGAPVPAYSWGTRHRNHCPFCLWSRHVDIRPGDRASLCGGAMEPIAIWSKSDGEVMVLHRCSVCGTIKANRCAGDDDEAVLCALASRVADAVGLRR